MVKKMIGSRTMCMLIPCINPKVHVQFTDVCVNMVVEFDDRKIP